MAGWIITARMRVDTYLHVRHKGVLLVRYLAVAARGEEGHLFLKNSAKGLTYLMRFNSSGRRYICR